MPKPKYIIVWSKFASTQAQVECFWSDVGSCVMCTLLDVQFCQCTSRYVILVVNQRACVEFCCSIELQILRWITNISLTQVDPAMCHSLWWESERRWFSWARQNYSWINVTITHIVHRKIVDALSKQQPLNRVTSHTMWKNWN